MGFSYRGKGSRLWTTFSCYPRLITGTWIGGGAARTWTLLKECWHCRLRFGVLWHCSLPFSLLYGWTLFIFLLCLKIFAGCRILAWPLLSLWNVKDAVLCCSLLCVVSSERSQVIQLAFSMPFFLTAFKITPLSLVLNSLILLPWGMAFFMLSFLRVYWDSWISGVIFLVSSRKFLSIALLLQVLPLFSSFFPLFLPPTFGIFSYM